MLGLKRTTLIRRSAAGEQLTPDEAERIADLSRLLATALSHGANSANGRRESATHLTRWLRTAHPRLDRRPPQSVMEYGFGRAQVQTLLNQDFAQGRL